MDKIKRTLVILILLVLPISVSSQTYPSRPLTIVVGFGVGGSVDRMARAMSSYLSMELGQPVNVVNRLGAGTLLGANFVLNQEHDGYTIFASAFSPYLFTTILEGNASYSVDDFAFVNFQWFDEDVIAINRNSRFSGLKDLMDEISNRPGRVRAAVVRGSAGHLMVKLLLDSFGIPHENLNLVTYNSGGMARAAVAGGVVDFIVISSEGTQSIAEYIKPLAVVSDRPSSFWGVPGINDALSETGITVPVIQGSIRGFATSRKFKEAYPERFDVFVNAMQKTLMNVDLQETLSRMMIGGEWIGPDQADLIMQENFEVFARYYNSL